MAEDLGVATVGTGIVDRAHAASSAAYHRSNVTGWVSRKPDLDQARLDVVPAFGEVSESTSITESSIEVALTDGVVHVDRNREQCGIGGGAYFTYPKGSLLSSVAGWPSGSAVRAVTHFVDCVLDSREPIVDMATSVHATEILGLIQESCESGIPAELKETA